ncbi:MAG: PAS domain-containing protein [Cystobacter sp.]
MNTPEQPAPEVPSPSSLVPSAPEGDSLFRQMAEAIPQLVWTSRPDGHHDYFNPRCYEYTGLTPEALEGEGWRRAFHPDDLPEAQRRWRHSLRTGEPYEVEYRGRRHDGTYRWFLGRALPLRDASGHIVKWFGTCTDIEDQKRAADSLQFLAETSSLLTSSLDYDATLEGLTRLAVPLLADGCVLYILDEEGVARLLGVAFVIDQKGVLARELHRRYPPEPKDTSGVYQVLRTGRSLWSPSLSDEALAPGARDAEHLRLLREFGARSSVTVPLKARDHVFGALQLIAAESQRTFSASDLALFEQIATRAALAVDNARQYRDAQTALRRKEEERFVVDTLQRVGLSLVSELEPVRLVKGLIDALVPLTGASFGAFLETRVEEHGEPSRLSTLPLSRSTPLFAPTFRGEAPVLLEDVTRHPEHRKGTPFQGLSSKHLPVRSYLGVAVKGRSGQVQGGLFLVHPEPARFTPVHARLAEGLAAWTAVALENARLHEGMRRAEERFRTLIQASSQAVWVTRSDGLIVEDSPSWREFTGQTFEEYQGFGWLRVVHPEDQERVRRGWEAGRALRNPYEVEMRVRRQDGQYATTLWRAVPLFSAPGEVREWVGTLLDVTAQRQAEEFSRRLESEQRTRQLEALRTRMGEALSREDTPEQMMQACAEVMTRCLPVFPLAQLWSWDAAAKVLRLKGHAGLSVPSSLLVERLELGQGIAGEVAQRRQPLFSNDAVQHPGAARGREWMLVQGLMSFLGIPLQVGKRLVGVLTIYGIQPLEEETLTTLSTVAESLAQGLERRRLELALRALAPETAPSDEPVPRA